jgi:AraC family transcriptional regulator, melibiose operon regulatory protein
MAILVLYPMTPFEHTEVNTFGLRVWKGTVDVMYPPHRHNEIELNAIEAGYFTYSLAGQQTTITRGEVALFWGAIPHQVIDFAPATQLHWGTVPLDYVLRWELPRPFMDHLLVGMMFRDAHPLYDQRFFARWQEDIQAQQTTVSLMEIKAMFFRFAKLPNATASIRDETHEERGHRRATMMASYMSSHFREPLTAAEITRIVNVQPNYGMRIFKRSFGMSLIEYLTQQRIAHAQQLLIITDANVTHIAYDSGFQTLSHFYTAFTRLVGMSPGKYRASLRK